MPFCSNDSTARLGGGTTVRVFWAGLALLFFFGAHGAFAKKVIVLGIDGMDPRLLKRYMAAGKMPNFSALAAEGDFKPLQTSAAPQSPVAWSTFITGMDPGGHGIYDFVHRDPATMVPHLSMAKTVPAESNLSLGSWSIPLAGSQVKLLRQGRAFWQILGDEGIPSTIFRMPVNFPPVEAALSRQLAGMGTPDILGTSGTFTFYTEKLPPNAKEFSGGRAVEVHPVDGRLKAKLYGPPNAFRRRPAGDGAYENPQLEREFQVYIDAEAKAVKLVVDQEELLLNEGEWSPWVPISFTAVPWLVDISATARFYLKKVDPHFELYVSPLQINPQDPAMPISSPPEWAGQLCACLGYFYTQEMPEDTKAFSHGVFSGREFWDQIMFTYEETYQIFAKLLEQHEEGLLFFYFGSVDQGSHMLWHFADREHPGFVADEFLADGIEKLYIEMDKMLAQVLERIDGNTTLVVMSDHGFSPFYWGVNLNTWLLQKGYIVLKDPQKQSQTRFFDNVNWKETKAYALGLNSVYVNLQGRERYGRIRPGEEYQTLLDRLEADLLGLRDPRNDRPVVSKVTRPRQAFSGPYKSEGADLLVGYDWGYRSSWKSPLGEFPAEVFVDNQQAWSGDHCIDNRHVPGVLLANRKITLERPALQDLTVGVLDEFGIPPLAEMIGRDCLADKAEKE